MLFALNQLGAKCMHFFKEPDAPQLFLGDPLSKLLPWEAYDAEKGFFILKNSIGFVVEAIPLVGTNEAVHKELTHVFQDILEEGDSLQCFLWADHRIEPFLSKWVQARQNSSEILKEVARRRRDHYIHTHAFSPRIFRYILSYSSASLPDKLMEKQQKILKTLQAFTYAFAWRAEHFLETLSALLNYSLDSSIQKRHHNPFQTLSTQIPLGGRLAVSEDSLCWETTHLKTFRAVDLPDVWSLAEMHALIGDMLKESFRMQDPFFLHYGVHCPIQGKEETKFKQRSHFIEKQGRSSLLLRMIPQLREELQERDILRHELTKGAKLLWTQFSAGIWSKEMVKAEQTLKSLFRINHFTLSENKFLHLPSYLASLPMTWTEYVKDLHELSLLRTTLSKECALLVPIQGEWMGTASPGTLLFGRRGQIVNWNPFDNKSGNYNTVVVGRSGSGKSVFMQEILLNGLSTGAKVFILEVGRSFEKLCALLEGQHILFSKDTKICLNPFTQIPKEQEEQETAFSFLKSIVSCMAAPTEGTSDYQNALIEKAIRQAWQAKGNEATITDVAEALHLEPEASQLSTLLTPYTKEGIYSKYFEGPNNIDFTSPLVLIELEELKDKKDLQAVVLQLFIMTITTQAFLGDRKTPFFICIDEAWDLLRAKQTGLFIETLARRLRKYFGSLLIGTQSIDDFYSTPGALAAYENSDWLCLLSQKKSSITRLAESGKVDMNPHKQHILETLHTKQGEYSEIMICDADGNYSIVRLTLDPFSQLLYTTKAQEYSKIKSLQEQGLTLTEAINRCICEAHP